MDDSFQIRCIKCGSKFRDRASRVQSGYSRECPHCEVVIFFEEVSNNANIRDALNEARRLRLATRREEADKAAPRMSFVPRR